MKITIAQINTRAGDFEATGLRVEGLSKSAVEQGAELLVLPMAAYTGPRPVDYSKREGYQIDLWNALLDLARRVACPCMVPVVMQMDDEPYHEVMLLQEGEVVPLRFRAFLQSEAGPQKERVGAITTFEFGGVSMALAQTYEDLEDLVDASVNVDVVLFVSDYSYALDDAGSALGSALAENRFRADAIALDAWLVVAGSVGGYGLQVYAGASFVMSPMGRLVASAPAFEESLLVAEVQGNAADKDAADGELYLEPEIYNRSLHLWQALSLGLRDYFAKTGRTDAVLAMDDTLASCLLAVLATDALGPTHVSVLVDDAVRPGEASVALDVARALRVNLVECNKHISAITDEPLRTNVLQAYLSQAALQTGAVVLHHADKTFLAVEASSASCRAAELLPFGDVYRTDLIELAHMRNTISPIVPTAAFGNFLVPAIDGLDEVELTPEARLKRVDVTLANHVEWERSLSDVVARQGEAAVCQNIIDAFDRTEAARSVWPYYLAMSSRPLFSARTPLGGAWRDRARTQDERSRAMRVMDELIDKFRGSKEQAEQLSDAFGNAGLSDLIKGMEVEFKGGRLEGVGSDAVEGTINELLGLLQEFSAQDGQLPIEGPFGPLTWGSPFSEN